MAGRNNTTTDTRRNDKAAARERERILLEKNLREDTVLSGMGGSEGVGAGKGRNPGKAKGKKKVRTLFRLKPYIIPQLPALITSCLLVLIVNASQLAKPYILSIVIDDFLLSGRPDSGWYSVFWFGMAYLAIVTVGSLTNIGQAFMVNRMGQSILMNIRRDVFRHILHMPMRKLDHFSSGRLITRATNDVETLNELFADFMVNLFKDVFLLIGITITMLLMNWRLALISFVAVPAIAGVTMFVRGKLRKNFVVVKRLIGSINGFFAENISGMRLVQLFRREAQKMKEFDVLNNAYFKATLTQIRMNSLLRPVMEIINSMAIALVVWFAVGRIADNALQVGVLFAFTNYIKQFFEPINDLSEQYSTVQSATVSVERIFELLDDKPGQETMESGDPIERPNGRVEFRNVWFAYNNEDWVLKDVSFSIEPGMSAAFVGATGAGKTTIISLMARFYEIQQGEILLDGKDIREIRLSDLRKWIAVVLQDVFLFSGTISENIRLNDREITDDEVAEALSLARADNFIDRLPNGMLEPVTERGSTFSAGQRQLLSFARAIAHDPALFILDEATANIDTETEQRIQESIANVSAGRTTIIIAHRLSTIRKCDRIFVMDHARLVEQGTHEELLEMNGYYAGLHRAAYESVGAPGFMP